jgi:hypothetical protein
MFSNRKSYFKTFSWVQLSFETFSMRQNGFYRKGLSTVFFNIFWLYAGTIDHIEVRLFTIVVKIHRLGLKILACACDRQAGLVACLQLWHVVYKSMILFSGKAPIYMWRALCYHRNHRSNVQICFLTMVKSLSNRKTAARFVDVF